MAEENPGVTVILGGTRGIGRAIAQRLAAPGGVMVLGYLENRARAEVLARELREKGTEIRLVEGNIANTATLESFRKALREGICHRLVHSVAVTSFKPLSRIRPTQWNLTLEVSARSLLDAVLALAEPLELARGAVVAISSGGSTRAIPNYGALGPAKAALEAIVRQLAAELGPRGIRVNAIRAGLIDGETLERFPPGFAEEVMRRTPLQRLGVAKEVAAAASFLLGPEASWITGQILQVDGGHSLT